MVRFYAAMFAAGYLGGGGQRAEGRLGLTAYVLWQPKTDEALCGDGVDRRWRDGDGASEAGCERMEGRTEGVARFDARARRTTSADAGDWSGAGCRRDMVGAEPG